MKIKLKVQKMRHICLLGLVMIFMSSCHKEGTGGKSSISGYVKHHELLIPGSMVYIKFGATEFPGTDVSKYDAFVPTGADAHYEFNNLRKGDYYLYGVGYDNSISSPVSGGVGIKLKYNKTIISDVPVVE
jgi:hypothetical protein